MAVSPIGPVIVPPGVTLEELKDRAAREALARAAAGELLSASDLMAIWHISRATFYRLNAAHKFDPFRVTPAIGSRCYSGTLIHRYINGDPVYASTFGRKVRR
jgi:hypothetical protein